MEDGHARLKMDEVDRHLENTWFTWIGGTQPDSIFYYRVQSPVILIEFDHQRPANLSKFATDPTKPTQQHIHCVRAHAEWKRLCERSAATALSRSSTHDVKPRKPNHSDADDP